MASCAKPIRSKDHRSGGLLSSVDIHCSEAVRYWLCPMTCLNVQLTMRFLLEKRCCLSHFSLRFILQALLVQALSRFPFAKRTIVTDFLLNSRFRLERLPVWSDMGRQHWRKTQMKWWSLAYPRGVNVFAFIGITYRSFVGRLLPDERQGHEHSEKLNGP